MKAPAGGKGLLDVTTIDVLAEKRKLRRHFRRFDIPFFLLCTVVGLDTLGTVASNGLQGLTWLLLLAAGFVVPYALLTAELGSSFPGEGGAYIWVKLAFGRVVAAISTVFYWVSNPIWFGGVLGITALATFQEFFNSGNHLPGPSVVGQASLGDVLFVGAFIWFGSVAAILSFKVGKWVPIVGGLLRIFVLGFFAFSTVVLALTAGFRGDFSSHDLLPSYAVFITALPIVFFSYIGFELPSAAGEEMTNPQRDVPFAVFRAALGAVLLYTVPVLAILLVLPLGHVTGLEGFIDAGKYVMGVYGGHVAPDGTPVLTGAGEILGQVLAMTFIMALLTSGTAWIMGTDRAQAIAALDVPDRVFSERSPCGSALQ